MPATKKKAPAAKGAKSAKVKTAAVAPAPAQGAKAAVVAPVPVPKKGKGSLVTLIVLAVLGGLAAQAYFAARSKAALKFDFVRAGAIIPQGLADGEGTGPTAILGDASDNVYFLDRSGQPEMRLQKFGKDMKFVSKYQPHKGEEMLVNIIDMGIDKAGTLYLLNNDGMVKVVDSNLKFIRNFKTPVHGARAIAADDKSRIFIASQGENKIQIFDPLGASLGEFGAPGTNSGDVANPARLTMGGGGVLAVLEDLPEAFRIKTFGSDLKMIKSFRVNEIPMCAPLRIGADDKGMLYINDHLGGKGVVVLKLSSGKVFGQVKGTTDNVFFISPGSIAANRFTGKIYVHTIPGMVPSELPSSH